MKITKKQLEEAVKKHVEAALQENNTKAIGRLKARAMEEINKGLDEANPRIEVILPVERAGLSEKETVRVINSIVKKVKEDFDPDFVNQLQFSAEKDQAPAFPSGFGGPNTEEVVKLTLVIPMFEDEEDDEDQFGLFA